MNAGDILIGLDLGTSTTKALACTLDGQTVAQATIAYDLSAPQPGFVEQDPEVVLDAASAALSRIAGELARTQRSVAAIGVSSAMHGVVPVDAAGNALGPFMTWLDRRSSEIADRWRADGSADELYARTGAPMHPMLPVCKLRWLADNEPALFTSAARFVSLKELLLYRWCGQWHVDYGIASATGMFDVRERAWNERALELAGVGAARLSEPVSPLQCFSATRGGIATALGLGLEVPLVIASSDGALANLGTGAIAPGETALTLGTSGACRAVVDAPRFDRAGRTFCYFLDDRQFIVGGPTSSAGASLNYVIDLLLPDIAPERRFAHALELAGQVAPGARGVTCLPFFSGERAPYWDARLRGGFSGVDLADDRSVLIRAAAESVVYTIFAVDRLLAELTGEPTRIVLAGGLTHAPLFRHMIADVFERTVAISDQDEASAFGAAMMAGVAVGAIPDLASVKARVRYPGEIRSDRARASAYRAAFARFERTVAAVRPLF